MHLYSEREEASQVVAKTDLPSGGSQCKFRGPESDRRESDIRYQLVSSRESPLKSLIREVSEHSMTWEFPFTFYSCFTMESNASHIRRLCSNLNSQWKEENCMKIPQKQYFLNGALQWSVSSHQLRELVELIVCLSSQLRVQ